MGFDAVDLTSNVTVQLLVLTLLFLSTNWFVFRSSRNLRLVNRVVFFVLLTIILYTNNSAPFTPVVLGSDTLSGISLSIAKAAWWLIGSACLVGFVRVFLIFERKPREARLLQDLVVAIIYVGAFLSVISYVFNVPVGTLVATSGVFAIILGLALQNTLSDVFSGVALNLGRPYSVGDWIVLEDGTEGRVVETNWRATDLLSGSNDTVTIPNSALAKSRLINRSNPDSTHGTSIQLRLAVTTTPSAATDVMATALRSANLILQSPPPSVKICGMDAQGIELELNFRVASIAAATAAKNEVFDLAFRHSKAAGIRLADAAGIAMAQTAEVTGGDVPHPSTAWRLLNAIQLLASLTEDEKETLSEAMTRRMFRKGEIIARQGEVFNSLLILRSGIVSIDHDGKELLRLSPGDWFGEGGLLTGSEETGTSTALTPVIAYEIAQDHVAALLKERPAIADEVSAVLSRRLDEERKLLTPNSPAKPAVSLASKIRHLFNVPDHPWQ